jgi:enterochelin esterase-like enzyme
MKKKLKEIKLCHNIYINKKQHSINAKKNIIKLANDIKKDEVYQSNRRLKKTLNLYILELETLKNEVDKFNAKT